jgi:hypothetical protein
MRIVLAASVFALVLPGTSCSVDIHHGYSDYIDLPVYPDARPVDDERPPGTNVSFEGSFSDTNVVRQTFESDDTPEMVLDFYRNVLRARGPIMECRGTIHVRRWRGREMLACVERPSSRAVRLAGGIGGHHSVVAVIADGDSAAQFALLKVDTGW